MDIGTGVLHNFFGNRMTFIADHVAIFDYDNQISYTYKDLRSRSDRIAAFLIGVMGLKKGDRIGICAKNRIEFFDLFFAAYKTGLILTTYNGKLMDWELEKLIKKESPSLLFVETAYFSKIENVICSFSDTIHLVNLDNSDSEFALDRMLEHESGDTDYFPLYEDILMLIHTGGTTGLPKAAMLSYRSVIANSISTAITHNLSPSDSTYLMMPLYHTAAWNSVSLGVLLTGGKIIIKRDFKVDDTYTIIQNERPTFLLGVPTIYQRLLQDPKFETTDWSSLLALRCGAAPMPPSLFESFDKKNLPFCNAYGLTECGPSNFSFPMRLVTQEILRKKVGSIGKPMYFNRVRIVDEKGEIVPPEVSGELEFSGPLVFSGYWKNEEETEKVMNGEWVKTGDIAICDKEGFYSIIGRKKNMFISGGENIFPIEIENVLMRHPAIFDCCVVGVSDQSWGEVGKAFIQCEKSINITAEELDNYLKGILPTIKIPKYYEFVNQIPRNSAGKLMLKEIEQMNKNIMN